MKKRIDLIIAAFFISAGLIVSTLHFPGGVPGMIIIFLGATFFPGYLLIRLFRIDLSDPLDIYPLSFVAGASLFSLWGLMLFAVNAKVDAAAPGMAIIGGAMIAMNWRREIVSGHKEGFGGPGGLGWAALAITVSITLFAFALGSFRGWGENWDYYTYITIVRRLIERGVAADYPVEYANEGPDPIHSFNVWALMWAAVGRGARMDAIALYVKSAVLTVPAALLSFYYFARTLFNRPNALVALLVYSAYHLLGLGLVILGRTSFYNADPAWLIFFPVAFGLAWTYADRGGKGAAITAVLVSCGTFLIHPLWGSLLVSGVSLIPLLSFRNKSIEHNRAIKIMGITGAAIFCIPLLVAVAAATSDTRFKLSGFIELKGGMVFFLFIPLVMVSPWLILRARALWNDASFKRSWIILALIIAALLPLVVMRYVHVQSARPEIFTATHPYKLFIASRLFILSFFNYTYTAPGMTLYPLSALGIIALPWLFIRREKIGPGAVLAAAGALLIPFIANHPYMSFLFVEATHTAYLRRALRVSAMFAACGGSVLIAAAVLKRPRYAGITAAGVALVSGVLFALYPYSPLYFQRAINKSWFVATKAPRPGLFWHPAYDAYKIENIAWDGEEFSTLVDQIPPGETVFSDRFTSYRLPAHRDIYVVCRMKPGAGVTDQAQRRKDQARFFRAETTREERCRILKKYDARWVILSLDPNYRLRDYYLGDPWTAKKLNDDTGRFRAAGRIGPWVMFEALETCLR